MSLNNSVVVASHSLREEFNQSLAAQMAGCQGVASDLSSLNSTLTQSILALSENSTNLIESVGENAKNDMLLLRQDLEASINDSSSKAIALSLETTVSSFQALNNSLQEARAEWGVEREAIINRINLTANAVVDASILLNAKMDLMEDSLRGETSAALSAISKSLSLVTANLTQLLTEGMDQSKAEFLAMRTELQAKVTNLSNSIDVHTELTQSHMRSFATSLNNTLETHRKEMDEANVTFSRLSGELETRVSADIQKSHSLSVEREAAMKASTEAKLAGHAEAVEVHIALVEEAMGRRVRAVEDRVTALVSDVRSLSHTLTHTALTLFANATSLLMTHAHAPPPPPPPSSSSVCECVSEERVRQIIEEMLLKKGP
jgi:predicted HicB family RNase H-like nuclease